MSTPNGIVFLDMGCEIKKLEHINNAFGCYTLGKSKIKVQFSEWLECEAEKFCYPHCSVVEFL